VIGHTARWLRARFPPSSGLAALGVSLAALTLLGASYRPVLAQGPILDPVAMAKVTGLVCLGGMLYLGAVAIVLTRSLPRRTLWIILACAVLMRCVLLATPPSLSTDIYRYVWDGRVQAAGINPYRYVPAAPELAALRDEDIYPHINRPAGATTIYPPVAEAVFFLVNLTGAGLAGMKVVMTAFEGLAIVVLLYLLPRAGLPRERVLIYAWNPVAVWEIAGNSHVDAVAIGFMALALLARAHRRPALIGIALAAATLVKLLPVCLFPALWQRWDWRMPLAFIATVVLAYLPYLGAGERVVGYLPGYVAEEGMDSGTAYYPLFLLSRVTMLPPWAGAAYILAGLVVLAVLALRIMLRERPLGAETAPAAAIATYRDCLVLSTAVVVLLNLNHPWYFLWLLMFACFVPSAAVLCLSIASFLLYLAYYDPGRVAQGLMYGAFWVLLLIELRRSRYISTPALDAGRGSW
jgi:alpha-1,6-mannosyltransferase